MKRDDSTTQKKSPLKGHKEIQSRADLGKFSSMKTSIIPKRSRIGRKTLTRKTSKHESKLLVDMIPKSILTTINTNFTKK